jgi:hypothetical protein
LTQFPRIKRKEKKKKEKSKKVKKRKNQGGGGGWSAYLAENVKSESVTDSSSHLAD